jgi:hypothetical protein
MDGRSIRTGRHPLGFAALLLGSMLVLAGCASRNGSADEQRRDGFYAGVIGGWSRP